MFPLVYKCECMNGERTVFVAHRHAGEDIVKWMQNIVTPAVTDDHKIVSPKCKSTTMEYVKLPLNERPGIGMMIDKQKK